jgi:4-hydroxy-tetrahydrodipicolinate synthase
MYSGIWLPIVTPFRDGEVDVDALQHLAEHYMRSEISGFVALGTTGEAALLSDVERVMVVQALDDVIGGRLPMLIGVGGSDTRSILRDIDRYERWDSAGYLVSPPAYICPDQTGIRWHFEQIASATERSIVLYNVPHRTGVSVAPASVESLLEHGNIVSIKECVPGHFRALCALPLSVLCGTDEAFVDCLEAGGAGGILASAHVCADLLVEVQQSMTANQFYEARQLFERIVPVLKLLFSAPNPSAIKAMLAFDHPMTAETRMPIAAASTQLVERLREAHEQLSRLRAELAGVTG